MLKNERKMTAVHLSALMINPPPVTSLSIWAHGERGSRLIMSSSTFLPPPVFAKPKRRPRALSIPKCNAEPTPAIRRSKMILTRRVFPWTLRKKRGKVRTLLPMPMPEPRVEGEVLKKIPIEAALNRKEPVATYLFQRGVVGFATKRRSGDPPCRYLELRYAHVEPFSAMAGNCSNPRARGGLRRWYQTARQWDLLHVDFRDRLELGSERRRFGGGDVGVKKLSTGGNVRREPVGKLVPLLVEGKWARAMGRSPRVIVIGDVHGCISELQQLLRLADFQPGDQVVLLGDLVAKGPDSVGVVQLAREIGARTVRGNHDYEVVRWWEAQSRGEGAMVSMEHAKIARQLGREEHLWLVESPWFIECAEMGHLFVHAGFIPGVKLTQQNPRLMMNMRSVLSDGTVTAKNVGGCEWAKLWKGPQTVVFGHDAFRGLQQYEFATGIDTGCVYGGRLTALLLPENRMISVAAKRAYVSPKKFRLAKQQE